MRPYFFLILAITLCGCSTDDYKRSADRDVRKILRDRENRTLAYDAPSATDNATPSDPAPVAKSFSKIPVTPITPREPPAVNEIRVDIPYGPLGPMLPLPSTQPAPLKRDRYGIEAYEQRRRDELQLGPPLPQTLVRRFDLFQSLDYATRNSRNYQTQLEELYLAALDVTLERHLFSPRPFVQTGLEYVGGQRDTDYRSALNATATAGVRQQLPYGGEVVARSLVTFVNALNESVSDGESAQVALSTSIPLLRGAGLVNLEPLILSEREVVYQIRAFEDFRRSFVVDIGSTYFNLITQQQSLANRRLNYANLSLLTDRTQALYDAGRLSFLEVQRSLQALLSAEQSLVSAQQSYQSALDNFKIQLGMPVEETLEIIGVELDLRIPELELADVVAQALRYRLNLQTARDRIDDALRGVAVAKNRLLPDLSITGDVSAGNPTGSSAGDIENRTLQYRAGALLDLPIDRVSERNAYRRSLIALNRTQRDYDEQQDRVAVGARDALRGIQAAQVTLQLQAAGIALAQRRLDFSNELLRQGKATARDVVESQSSLLDAQDRYDQARAQLQIQLLRYLRETGTLRVDPDAGAIGEALDAARRDRRIDE